MSERNPPQHDDTVKAAIEKHPLLLGVARSLHYNKPNSTLADLRAELKKGLAVVDDLVLRYGEKVSLNDKSVPPSG